MNPTELDKKLKESHDSKERSWTKLISIMKRQMDSWATAELAKHGYEDFKLGHMPFLMNISPEGITNTELARKARVSKQAMSKVVNELFDLGYIETVEHDTDKRSSLIRLTAKGKKLVITARQAVCGVEADYERLFGKLRFEAMKDMMIRIIAYNEEHLHSDRCP